MKACDTLQVESRLASVLPCSGDFTSASLKIRISDAFELKAQKFKM